MINLTLLNLIAFQLDSAILPRQFETILSKDNKIILRNVRTGYRISLGTLPNITIENQPATYGGIRKLAYNFSCSCTGTGSTDVDFKIFDFTFDPTFN